MYSERFSKYINEVAVLYCGYQLEISVSILVQVLLQLSVDNWRGSGQVNGRFSPVMSLSDSDDCLSGVDYGKGLSFSWRISKS
ncbi:hypothetical protein OLMES_0098 [Oleiphilus messinensis]|uniref:Uncharacterized protein n=1 Tax=Oleiphilus messinensis TaxID=141451 RepID=A0A1Y0I170_9GAMM|nr:hypothetical protein OLMES_0098 [Oleiphilus messinensis]